MPSSKLASYFPERGQALLPGPMPFCLCQLCRPSALYITTIALMDRD